MKRLKAILLAATLLTAVPAQAATFDITQYGGHLIIAGLPVQQNTVIFETINVSLSLGCTRPSTVTTSLRSVPSWPRCGRSCAS